MHLLLLLGNERAWQDAPELLLCWQCRNKDRGALQATAGCCSRSLPQLLSPVLAGFNEVLEREENLQIPSCDLLTALIFSMNNSRSQV